MPTYVTLFRWTGKGIENVKDSPARLEKVKAAAKAAGGQVKAFYMTMGRYDGLLLTEAPNDEAYAKMILGIGSSGNVSTETMKAFTEEEYRKVIASL